MSYTTCELVKALLSISLMQIRILQRQHWTPEREQDIRDHQRALVEVERLGLAA